MFLKWAVAALCFILSGLSTWSVTTTASLQKKSAVNEAIVEDIKEDIDELKGQLGTDTKEIDALTNRLLIKVIQLETKVDLLR